MKYLVNAPLPAKAKDCRECRFYRVTDQDMTCELDGTDIHPADARWCDGYLAPRDQEVGRG